MKHVLQLLIATSALYGLCVALATTLDGQDKAHNKIVVNDEDSQTIMYPIEVAADDKVTYVVYPKNGKSKDDTAAIKTTLSKYAAAGDIVTEEFGELGVFFWALPLSAADAQVLKADPKIAQAEAVCQKDCFDPSTAVTHSTVPTDGAAEMSFISQQKGHSLAQYKQNYYYDEKAGERVTVLILDTGADIIGKPGSDLSPQEGCGARAVWRFLDHPLSPFPDYMRAPYTDKRDSERHGTCMLGKVCGKLYGSAKGVIPVIVKMPRAAVVPDWLSGLNQVLKWSHENPNAKAVLSLSEIWPKDEITEVEALLMHGQFTWLSERGITIVVGSGNKRVTSIDGVPALWGSSKGPYKQVAGLIVVGAVTNDGKLGTWNYDRSGTSIDVAKGLPHVYAPGVGIHCADVNGNPPRVTDGTSPATATVAGLVAYLMSISTVDRTPEQWKHYVVDELAWARKRGLKGIWNGVAFADIREFHSEV